MKHCERCKKPTTDPKNRFCTGCTRYMLTKMHNDGYFEQTERVRRGPKRNHDEALTDGMTVITNFKDERNA